MWSETVSVINLQTLKSMLTRRMAIANKTCVSGKN